MNGRKNFHINLKNQPNEPVGERVVSERGRKELPPSTRGGENLKPNRYYEHKQHAFDSYCKKVLKCEACNGYRQISRHQKRFASLEELSGTDVAQLAVYDRYSWEYTAFPVGNAVVLIENDRLATALLRLSPKDREIFMMHWFLWMTDEQMADTTYMTGKEAVEKGFADELLDDAEPLEISASADSQTISCKGHALRLMPGVKLPDNIPLAKAPAPVAPAAANTKTAVEPANTNEGGQTPMAKETNGAQTPTPAVENPQAAVDAAVSAERHRLEEIDQIAGLFNAEMVHEAKYGATACDARELAFRAAKQATQQGLDFLTALGIDNQQSGTQSVSAVPGESAEGSPEGTPAELTPAEKMAAARQSVKALLHPETNKEGKNNG